MEDTLKFDELKLLRGSHERRADGMCAMEAAAWLAGEPHTDSPACVSPILREFIVRWNDDLDDEGRQRLKPYIPRVLGTAGDGKDELRGWLAADWLVRVCTPAWLELAGITESSNALRALPPLRSLAALDEARTPIETACERAAGAREAATAGATAAAWAAAREAARAVSKAAAWDFAAARDAASKQLAPTKIALQASAFELLGAMIDPPATEA